MDEQYNQIGGTVMKKEWQKIEIIFKNSFLALQNQNIEDEGDQKVQERGNTTLIKGSMKIPQ